MAFEGVFSNIDFQAPNRAATQQQNLLMQAIGQGMANYNRSQDRELQSRQLDMTAEANKAKAAEFNLEKAGKQALYDKLNGKPYDASAIAALSQYQGEKVYTDPVTQQTIRIPTLMERSGVMNNAGANPAMTQGYADIKPAITDQSILDNESYDITTPDALPKIPQEQYNAPESMGARGKIKEMDVNSDIFKETLREQRAQNNLQKYNDGQLIAANFANRMNASADILDGLMPEAKEARTGWLGRMAQVMDILPLGEFGTMTGEAILQSNVTPEQQKYLNAAQNWLTANLRKESGAAIPASELAAEYTKYFPVAGDKGAVIEQKKMLRKQAEKGMIGQSAGSYQLMFGKKAQAQQDTSKSVSYEEYFK